MSRRHNGQGEHVTEKPLSVSNPLESIGESRAKNRVTRRLLRQLALDEFELDERDSEDDEPAIPIRTVTGRVYKSFEEMLSDPTYPMSPVEESLAGRRQYTRRDNKDLQGY